MARKRPQINIEEQIDTDLDLAPLLSIMVKLIPVLLLSSAFVQIMMIETDLPQPVKSAIEQNQNRDDLPELELAADYRNGFQVSIFNRKGPAERVRIPLKSDQSLDFTALNSELVKIKARHTQVFEISLIPAQDVNYQDVVKIMDMARRPLERDIKFDFIDPATEQTQQTEFMFPEVTFANVIEG